MNYIEPIPFRIRLGVTGHRKLCHEDKLKEKVLSVLENEIGKLFDEKSLQNYLKLPDEQKSFLIVTPLAEGADRLVANVVLGQHNTSGVNRPTIEVVLPLTLDDYIGTFDNKKDPDFRNLLSLARNVVQIRKYDFLTDPEITCAYSTDSMEDRIRKARKEAYWKAGRYVVDHSDVLIAIWNGEKSNGRGGTKEIIDYAKKRKRPVIIIQIPPCGSKQSETSCPEFNVTIDRGVGLNGEAIQYITEFNRLDTPRLKTNPQEFLNKFFIPGEDKLPSIHPLPNPIIDPSQIIEEFIAPYYLKASHAAKSNKNKFKTAGTIIYVNSTIAVTSVILGVLFKVILSYSYFIEFFFLAGVLLVYLFIQRVAAHQKWLENRFITERLRSASFFIIANLELPPIEIPPFMGLAHKSNDWMVLVFAEIWNRIPKMQGVRKESMEWLKKTIIQRWISDQIRHHEHNAREYKKTSDRMKRACIAIFVIALVVPLIHIVKHFTDPIAVSSLFDKILILFAIALPAIGAAIEGIRTSNEYVRIEKRSANMVGVLTEIQTDLEEVNDVEGFERIMHYTDEITLRENQDWLTFMRVKETPLV